MTNPPTPEPGAESVTLAELEARYGDWQIELEHSLGMWSAVRKSPDGRHIRVLISRQLTELAAKLETAETVEP